MELDEALRVLGVPECRDSKTARRAYLSLIKTHEPERDPEGFRRVREAWECALASLPTPDDGSESDETPDEDVVDAIFEEAPNSPRHVHPSNPTQTALDSAVHLWRETLEQDQIEPAAHHLLRALSEAEREADGDRIPGEAVLYTLGNLAPSNAGLFLKLYEACEHWTQTHIGGTDCFTGHAAVRWKHLQELMQARERLSAPTFAILAQLIATDDSRLTVELMRRCEQNEGQAIMDRDRLLVYAPNVARLFGDYLLHSTPEAPTQRLGRKFHWWPLLLLGFVMIRVIGGGQSSGEDPDVERDAPLTQVQEQGAPLQQQEQKQASTPDTPVDEAASDALVRGASTEEAAGTVIGAVDGDAVEHATSALLSNLGGKVTSEYYLIITAREALRTGSCQEAGRALAELDTASTDGSADQREQIGVLWNVFSGKCPGHLQKYKP